MTSSTPSSINIHTTQDFSHIYKCLHRNALRYLQQLCLPIITASADRCSCRSTSSGNKNWILRASQLHRVQSQTLELQSIAPSLRDTTLTLNHFCSRLKTYQFSLVYRRALFFIRYHTIREVFVDRFTTRMRQQLLNVDVCDEATVKWCNNNGRCSCCEVTTQ